MEYILLIFIHVGALSDKDSMTSLTIPSFTSEQECIKAGTKSTSLVKGTVKELNFTCIQRLK